jgi:phage/plasmid-associated DNA primase
MRKSANSFNERHCSDNSRQSLDEAIRSRIHLVEFGVTIPEDERDPTIAEKLPIEYGGILSWCFAGCLDWHNMGLRPPEAVNAATLAYLDGEDNVQTWMDECCERRGQIALSVAHRSYRTWCESNSVFVIGRNTFADQLEARGCQRFVESKNKSVMFSGLSLQMITSFGLSH